LGHAARIGRHRAARGTLVRERCSGKRAARVVQDMNSDRAEYRPR
jgi:hypothetical protein